MPRPPELHLRPEAEAVSEQRLRPSQVLKSMILWEMGTFLARRTNPAKILGQELLLWSL